MLAVACLFNVCKNFLFESIARADALSRFEGKGGSSIEDPSDDGVPCTNSDKREYQGGGVELQEAQRTLAKKSSSLWRMKAERDARAVPSPGA